MKIKSHVLSLVLLTALAASGLQAANPGAKTVVISASDTMKYSVTSIEAHPGEKVTVQLKNDGTLPKEAMGHNWVLLKAGVDPQSYANSAITAKAEGFEPKALADKVIASIKLLGPKETGSVTFTAPSVPGNYAYLCSFPAHCQVGMKGVLVVK
ncbi:MAG: plastocyanin/azurin family copper-binding protein [Chthoniobacter sp.]|nr:plastocyanin/azurin family copper-binding protein [Chthoniobacter sp.]